MITLAILIVIIAWLTAASIAVRAVSRIWLRHWIERRPAGFVVAERYLERPTRLLLAASAAITLTTLCVGIAFGRMVGAGLPGVALLAALAVVLLVLGFVVPRVVARRWAPRLVPIAIPPLRLVEILLAPLVAVTRWVEQRLQRDRPPAELERDGLQDLLREGELEGVGERDEIAIISGVVRFGEKTLREVMTPRSDVFALDESLEAGELARRIAESAYSRVPVTRNHSLDEVAGMVLAFDVLRADGDRPDLRPVFRATPEMRCNELLFRMLRARAHLALVAEQGRTLGIVTLEDLLEELVGDIRDEHDEPDPAQTVVRS